MTLLERLNELSATGGPVFGEPFETADGTTVITAAGPGLRGSRPIGVFVIHQGEVKWEAASDSSRIAILGVLTGLFAATLGCLAVLRQPPWPNLRFWDIRTRFN
ncbi:hypothetical protein [Nocardia tengchongensis]|uniref:hypothetical protein n=1 Tax=Nocardia tengchongensis TaxID=2055889 RepID=UPI00367539A6